MYYVMRASAPSLHRESTDSLMCVDNILHLLSVPPGIPVHEANITVYKRNQYKVVIQTRLLNQRGTSRFCFRV